MGGNCRYGSWEGDAAGGKAAKGGPPGEDGAGLSPPTRSGLTHSRARSSGHRPSFAPAKWRLTACPRLALYRRLPSSDWLRREVTSPTLSNTPLRRLDTTRWAATVEKNARDWTTEPSITLPPPPSCCVVFNGHPQRLDGADIRCLLIGRPVGRGRGDSWGRDRWSLLSPHSGGEGGERRAKRHFVAEGKRGRGTETMKGAAADPGRRRGKQVCGLPAGLRRFSSRPLSLPQASQGRRGEA